MCRQVYQDITFMLNLPLLFFTLVFIWAQWERKHAGKVTFSCFSPQRSDGEGTVHLDGEGYAAVGRPTRWNPNISTVAFKFRTFSSESLLMYLATEDMVGMQSKKKKKSTSHLKLWKWNECKSDTQALGEIYVTEFHPAEDDHI